jgi:threonine synthase
MTVRPADRSLTGSTLTHLEGSESQVVYDADTLHRTDPADGRPLLARYDLARAARRLPRQALAERRSGGMWRWAELLPVRSWSHVTSLGEGATPLVAPPPLARALGIPGLHVKLDGLNPTGTFKARGMAAAVSRAVELGVTSFVVPSAGNAAGALAAYGAAAGADVTVVIPSDAPDANREEATVAGAQVVLVDGLISDCARVAAEIAERTGAFDVSTLKEPYRVEGKKTMGYELAEDFDWRLPDVVVYPTGGGTGLVGMWKAFAELETVGLLTYPRPRMVAVQAAGCAPIVRAYEAGAERAEPWENAATRAGGIRVPAAIGDTLILDALRASGGTALSVDEASIDDAQLLAARHGLGYVSPESAAALAGAADLRAGGDIGPDERVVVFDTGIGAKYPPPTGLPDPPRVDPDHFDVD